MPAKELPSRPSLEQYKKQAKELVKSRSLRADDALQRIKHHHPRFCALPDSDVRSAKFSLTDAQLVIAREHGFDSWPKFAKHIEASNLKRAVPAFADPWAAFIEAACVPLDADYRSGTLERADSILTEHPEVARRNIYAAAILGDDAVREFLALDARNATAKGGPYGWDALTYLCFSKYLRLDRARSDGLVRAARVLLDAGANPNTGWHERNHAPKPQWESALYGAAGVAQHPELTRLLLERGADPNDEETPYHAPETGNNAALQILVQSGKLNEDSLATMLLRKTDWHDYEGIQFLVENGADPNRMTRWHHTALHHALRRDNHIKNIELLLDHGANPALENRRDGKSAIAMAARRGRGDVLNLFERRGIRTQLEGADQLVAACANNDGAAVRSLAEREPHFVREVLAEGGTLLAEFAGNGNTEGLRHLLDLGVGITALYQDGDDYFDVATDSTALHVAAWRAWPSAVKVLVENGAPVDAVDGKGRTPLALAVRACVDSYWTHRRTPESVEALLRAGASVRGIDFPSRYEEVDELLRRYRESTPEKEGNTNPD